MKAIELARKAAEMGQREGACRAYSVAILDGADITPAERLEAAAYVLQFGGDYTIAYNCFRDLYNEGHFREEVLPLMTAAFYEPNETLLRGRYERNIKLLEKYPYLFRQDFPAFEDLPIRFFPFDDHNGYLPYYRDRELFGEYVNFRHEVVSRNFFKDLDKPILAEEVFSQYELEYLRDNVRRSEYVGRENHVYLHYPDWETFCAYLQVLNMRPLVKEEKLVFLIGDEIEQYPIDFKERFGIDYSQYPVKPLGIGEINRLIWHVQLSSHNGGDFFNEILDAHPNLLALTSVMLYKFEEMVSSWRESVDTTKRSAKSQRDFLRSEGFSTRVIQELCNIQKPTDKDILVAYYLSDKRIPQFLDPAARIVPALFFQPHFHVIDYELRVDRKDRTVLEAEAYDQIHKSPIFRGFKYIKTFIPMRRFTTSHGGTVRFMYQKALENAERRREGKAEKDEKIVVVSDAVTQRVLNRSFMADERDRLTRDAVVVRLEDGKLNPKATFTALAAFLDLPYTESMTYCSEFGKLDPHPDTKGFDPAPIYKTYDDYVNDSERKYIEYFLRDAYQFYGYDFHYYDGGEVTLEQVQEWLKGFTTIDHYIRETWGDVYKANNIRFISRDGQEVELQEQVADKIRVPVEELQERAQLQLLERKLTSFHKNREKISEYLMRGLRFMNRRGQPLRMIPLLEPDPDLLEQPLYH